MRSIKDKISYLNDYRVGVSGVDVERDGEEAAPQQEDLGGAAGRVPHEGLERPAQPEPEDERRENIQENIF